MDKTSSLVGAQLATLFDEQHVGECEHFVHFYERDASLFDALHGFLSAGLRNGDACIVIATAAHRATVEYQLQAGGLDVDEATAHGRYVALDAAETLSRFMVDGQPNAAQFMDVLGTVMASLPAGRPIRAFGEMVALLCAEGNMMAASRLEGLWNDLGRHYRFSLFCAYPLSVFRGDSHAGEFADICAHHARVVPTERLLGATTADEFTRLIATLQQKAAALEAEVEARKAAEERVQALNVELQRKVEAYEKVVLQLEASRAELHEKIRDLERFEEVVIGRELKMIELERDLDRLKRQIASPRPR